uniref:C2H2-type domain-containing protein n=1 Tax=Phlebotomus papatasi TaxID=29031 RepID=A0A1B0CYD6_PHLPP
MLVHFPVDPVTCTICQKTLKNRDTLRRHMKIHSAERIHECGICGFKFYHKANVRRHIRDVHKQNPEYPVARPKRTLPPCRLCGKIFWKDGEYASHMLEEHNDDKPFECTICLKKFKVKLYLTRHMGLHETDKAFSCEVCGQSFRKRVYLKMHQVRVHKCKEKNKNTAVQVEHENVQEVDDKPFECLLCLKKFKRKIYLKKHMVRHETNKPNTPYACTNCKISFKTKEYFWRHQAKHHKTKIEKISKPKEKSDQEIEAKVKEENPDDCCMELPNKTKLNPEYFSVIKIEKE